MNFHKAESNYRKLPSDIRTKALTLGWLRFVVYTIGFVVNPLAIFSNAPFLFFAVTCCIIVFCSVISSVIASVRFFVATEYILTALCTVALGFTGIPNIWAAAMVLFAVHCHWLFKQEFRSLEKLLLPKVSRKCRERLHKKRTAE